MMMVVQNVYPFLAATERVPADVLVIEGWVTDNVFEEALVEFERGHYRMLYVTGGPIEKGAPFSEYKSWAELGAATLRKMGAQDVLIKAVPSAFVKKDRTFASAIALRSMLQKKTSENVNLNLITLGAHAKRSQMLFQKVFGESSHVGIIAIDDLSFDSKRWWASSSGFRSVVDESIAFIYAMLVFPFANIE